MQAAIQFMHVGGAAQIEIMIGDADLTRDAIGLRERECGGGEKRGW